MQLSTRGRRCSTVKSEHELDQTAILTYGLLALSLLCFLYFLNRLWGFYHDDAYIILRYARNLLDGRGLVWNPGERVEGYSCFLWLMCISFLGYCTMDLVTASQLGGIVFALLVLLLPFVYGKKNATIGALLVSTNSCFALWALGGLETVMFCFFAFAGVYAFLQAERTPKNLFFTGIIFCLAAMTRFEGLLLFGLTGITLCFGFFNARRTFTSVLRDALFLLAGFLLLYGPYFIWRYGYFGHLFPCTYYVKGGSGNILKLLFGTRYVAHFALLYGFPLGILLILKNYRIFIRNNLYLLCILVCYTAYIVSVGGDHMPGFRFIVPVLPILYLFIARALMYVRFQRPAAVWALVIFLAGLNCVVSSSLIADSPEEFYAIRGHSYMYKYCTPVPDSAAYYGKHIGLHMKRTWPADALIACNTAGSTPYYSELAAIDMLGLNDYRIAQKPVSYGVDVSLSELLTSSGRTAFKKRLFGDYHPWQLMPGHGKGDGAYVLSRKPDYIIIGPATGATEPWFLSDREIFSSPEFFESYRLVEEPLPIADDFTDYFMFGKNRDEVFRYYKRVDDNSRGL